MPRARGHDFGELSPDCDSSKGFLDVMKKETLELHIRAGDTGKTVHSQPISVSLAVIFRLRASLLPQLESDAGDSGYSSKIRKR